VQGVQSKYIGTIQETTPSKSKTRKTGEHITKKQTFSCLLFDIKDLTLIHHCEGKIRMNHQSKPQHHYHLLQQSDIGSRTTPAQQLPYQQLFLIALIHAVKGSTERI